MSNEVSNNGRTVGKEVVQLYLKAPTSKLNKPEEELKAFAKTALLQPGKSQTLVFSLKSSDLSSFYTQRSAWVAEPGNYTIRVGRSSRDIKLVSTFFLPT